MAIIADLFAKLGLKVDTASFSVGQKLMKGIQDAILVVAAFKGAKFLAHLVEETVEAGSKFHDMSQQLGIAVEPLQEFTFAAEQSDVSLEALSGSLGKLSKNAYEAFTKGGDAAKSFRQIGVSVRDSHGKLKPTDALLKDIAEKFKKMPDGPKKTALAMGVFGRAGKQLIPFLNEGREGLEKLKQEFIATGAEISGADAAALDEFGDEVSKFKKNLTGLQNQVVIGLLPSLVELLEKLKDWVASHRDLIKDKLEKTIKGLIVVAKGLAFVLDKVVTFLAWLSEQSTNVQIAFGLLGAAIAMAISPLLAVVGPISAIIFILNDLYELITTGKSTLSTLLDPVSDALAEAIEWIVEKFTAVFDWLADKFNWVADKFKWIADKVSAVGDFFSDDSGVPIIPEGAAALSPQLEAFGLAKPADTSVQNSFTAGITVNAAPGMSEKQLAVEVKKQFKSMFDSELRTADAALGQ